MYRVNPEEKCFLRKTNSLSNSIQYFHPQRSLEGYVHTFDETILNTSRIRPFFFSTVASFKNCDWRQQKYSSSEMDLDLHFTTLFSVVGKRHMCCYANICNKLSRNSFWWKCWVFVSSSNKMQVRNVIASIPQSTDFFAVGRACNLFLAHSRLLASICISVALQNHLFGQKISCRNN